MTYMYISVIPSKITPSKTTLVSHLFQMDIHSMISASSHLVNNDFIEQPLMSLSYLHYMGVLYCWYIPQSELRDGKIHPVNQCHFYLRLVQPISSQLIRMSTQLYFPFIAIGNCSKTGTLNNMSGAMPATHYSNPHVFEQTLKLKTLP